MFASFVTFSVGHKSSVLGFRTIQGALLKVSQGGSGVITVVRYLPDTYSTIKPSRNGYEYKSKSMTHKIN